MHSRLKATLASIVAAVAALAATPSAAVEYVGAGFADASPNNAVVSYGSGAAQSFDVNFGVLTRVTLAFVTFRDETAPTMSFNALVNNFAGLNIDGLIVKLTGGAVFQAPNGTVTPTFGTLVGTSASATTVTSALSPGEGFAISFGNPLAMVGQADWTVDFSAVDAGSTFGITVTAVPEADSYAMLLAG
ncbi:MAG: hypothetical protein JNM90_12970, partial [Burkholderiales bacterium]|nr:hypothetical protein [Burkholderiales bacterium]